LRLLRAIITELRASKIHLRLETLLMS